jgi:hypothetical protein
MSSARTVLRERVAALAQARRAVAAGRLDDAERLLQHELSRWPENRDAQSLLAEVAGLRRSSTPGDADPDALPPPAGLAEGWSAFEARVRDRKVARLVERARKAIDAGALTEALAAVEEIEAIAPGHPFAANLTVPVTTPSEPVVTLVDASASAPGDTPPPGWVPSLELAPPLDVVLENALPPLDIAHVPIERPSVDALDEGRSPVARDGPSARRRTARAVGLLLAAAGLVALSGWAGYRWLGRTPAPREATPVAGVAQPGVTAPAGSPSAREDAESAGAEPTGTAGRNAPVVPGASAAPPAAAERPSAEPSQPVRREAVPQQAAAAPVPTPIEPPPTVSSPPERGNATSATSAASSSSPTEVTSRGEGQPLVVAPSELPAPRDDTAPPAAAGRRNVEEPPTGSAVADTNRPDDTPPDDLAAMRGLIEGYLAGYNNLDAGGVHAVWPAVDRRALARAFGQLANQRLVFSRCEVRGAGDSGNGFCLGRATWRPRVGGGERTERRVWRFDFTQHEGRWAIDAVDIER